MAEMYQVNLKVVSQKGECAAGHKVGDEGKFKIFFRFELGYTYPGIQGRRLYRSLSAKGWGY